MFLSGINLYALKPSELADLVKEMAKHVGVTNRKRIEIEHFTNVLKVKGEPFLTHFYHSQRVSIFCPLATEQMLFPPRASYYSGRTHDIGKAHMDRDVLGNTGPWTAADYEHMRIHVERSHELLRGKFDFTAEIVIWHHRFQQAGYPDEMPKWLHDYSSGTQVLIPMLGRILALCDVYDALHRGNARFNKQLTGMDIYQKMLEWNPDMSYQVEKLYEIGIFDPSVGAAAA